MKKCPKCGVVNIKKDGVIYTKIMSKNKVRTKKIQNYRCIKGHSFNFSRTNNYTNSFIEFVVFVYLNCLSLNTTINIIRAYYEEKILSKATILDFLETVADEVPDIDSIDNILYPKRSGYLALDGVWFNFRGREIVLLVCFDPETFDVIDCIWSLEESERSYTDLLMRVTKKLGFDNIKGVYGDGDKGLINSLKKHLPLVPFQLCIVHKEMRMGQLVPVKIVNRSKRLTIKTKKEILKFQELFRKVIYAETKQLSYLALKELKQYVDNSKQERFKKAYRSLKYNFQYTLTHFDHPNMERDNNLIECFNGIIKPRLKLMKSFKKYGNLDRYLKLFILNYRFHKLRESRFEERRGLSPLECAQVTLPEYYNFLTFLRNSLNLDFTKPSP